MPTHQPQSQPGAKPYRPSPERLAALRELARQRSGQAPGVDFNPFAPAKFPLFAMPKDHKLAMDEQLKHRLLAKDDAGFDAGTWSSQAGLLQGIGYNVQFLGYPELAVMAQQVEYRQIVSTLAREATREWIEFAIDGEAPEDAKDDDVKDRVKQVEDEIGRLGAQQAFCTCAEHDGFFGRGHLYIDTGHADDPDELKLPLRAIKEKFPKGGIGYLKAVEPVWTYPINYESVNPLRPDWYNPTVWYVMGQNVHASRLLRFVGHEVPDLLKPAYSFGGLSLSQLCKPYVDIWLQTRRDVGRMINSYAIITLATDLSSEMSPGAGGQTFNVRMEEFNLARNNLGILVMNKDGEELTVNTISLAGLHELQSQALEHLCTASGEPAIELLGVQPQGFNASSSGEIDSWERRVGAYQKRVFDAPLRVLIEYIQAYLFGEVDKRISWKFKPLQLVSPLDRSTIQLNKANTDKVYLDANVISAEEVRAKVADDPDSGYDGIEVDDIPEQGGLGEFDIPGAAPGPENEEPWPEARRDPRAAPDPDPVTGLAQAADKEFEESRHPRDREGKFSRASGAGTKGERLNAETGESLPDHIKSLKIPPAWTDVRYALSPDSSLLATGRDAKGRPQAIYSLAHQERQAAAKFARVQEMARKFDVMRRQNDEKKRDPKLKDTADCLDLIMQTGIRPGSEEDTGAENQAYGATTLLGSHVAEDDGAVRLVFVGKKGINLSIPVNNAGLADELRKRAKAAGPNGKLFPGTDAKKLLEHVHSLDGGGFKTKDFRTNVGTATALDVVSSLPVPNDEKSYRKQVMAVAKQVALKLGNTPIVALQSYINPSVFADWRSHAAGSQIREQRIAA